jgi:hypothetical protein
MIQLAIKGHPTRGNEVIEILEMLGGENKEGYCGHNPNIAYYISHKNTIVCDWGINSFTLEEFLEKFPYKIGDKVLITDDTNDVYIIKSMIWNTRTEGVAYRIETINGIEDNCDWYADEMVHYKKQKEETMEEQKKDYEEWFQINYLEFENNDDTWADEVEVNLGKDYEIQIRGDKTFIVKKQSQYPKTYEECCSILNLPHSELTIDVPLHYSPILISFTKLLICRDAYWKIAGEQMKLGKPWEPKHEYDEEIFFIYCDRVNGINKGQGFPTDNFCLSFPTKEMRDAFYENFKELIEKCKELL